MLTEAKKLKEEGNALFLQNQYLQACSKFSAAISLDGNNAILYANRAACRIAMSQYLDALADGKKATELDPNYPKAWYRCGSALGAMGQYAQSANMFEKTLEAFSKLPDASIDKNLQKQCESQLAQARKAEALPIQLSVRATVAYSKAGLPPWLAAANVLSSAAGSSTVSSAWVMLYANKEFTEGIRKLNRMEAFEIGGGQQTLLSVQANMGVLVDITNAILREPRVFRIEHPRFLGKMEDQILCERTYWKSWPTETGPEALREKVLERLSKEGWDSCRRAVTCLVRSWLFSGFVAGRVTSNFGLALELHRNALEIINWGRQVWKDIPRDKRGVIFDLSFRRGVWNMLLNTLLAALSKDSANLGLIETVFKEADAIIRDIDDNPYKPEDFSYNGPPDPGFYFSFFACIKGNALACKGLYHDLIAHNGQDSLDFETIKDHYASAVELYIEAANCLPEDDEYHPWFLKCAYGFMEITNTPTRRVMSVLERIRISLPKMRKMWHQNPSTVDRHKERVYAELLKVEKHAKLLCLQNAMTLDGPFAWDAVKHL